MHHDVRDVVHAECQSLSMKADDARATGPDHLDLSPMVKPDLTQAMGHVAVPQNLADLALFSSAELGERHDPCLLHRRNDLPR
jgi:hypothetical protein